MAEEMTGKALIELPQVSSVLKRVGVRLDQPKAKLRTA